MSQPESKDQRAIIAIVKGGLGNQLFIYAAARALALRTGRRLLLDATTGFAHDRFDRAYRLNRFPIQAEVLPAAEVPWHSSRDRRQKVIRAWNSLLPPAWRSFVAERKDGEATQLTALRPCREQVFLSGYWQDESYFADHAEAIRRELSPPVPTQPEVQTLGDRMANGDSVFVHVRRVRYTPILQPDYYQAALSEIFRHVPNPRFYLFGDDREWLQKSLDYQGRPVQLVAEADELADLWLMTRCRHAITANSSFSWWGAWLGGGGSGRQIISPSQSGLPLTAAPYWRLISADLDFSPRL